MSALEVRPGHLDDLAAIMALESVFDHQWSEQAWTEEIQAHLVFVTGDPVVSVASVSVVADVAEVRRIIVSPMSQRLGLGRALMTHGLGVAASRGAREVFLEVSAHNEVAIGFYHALGFAEVDRRRDYYGAGEDALIFRRAVGESGRS